MIRRLAPWLFAVLIAPSSILSAQGSAGAKSKAPAAAPLRFTLGATGNEARYRVHELLAASTLENDAVGVTKALTGGLQVDANGRADTMISRWTVDLTTLKSDRSLRDRFLQKNALETNDYPKAQLVVTEIKGLPTTLPATGTLSLTLFGRLTVHGVTKPTSWDVTANVSGDHISGMATTHFTFAEFNMTQPRVPVIASLADDIRLEYDFHLIREHGSTP